MVSLSLLALVLLICLVVIILLNGKLDHFLGDILQQFR